MRIVHDPKEFQKEMLTARSEGKKIGFVPTMGALHAGHTALAERIRQECDILVMSVFVNPLQFAPSEDLDKYPRTLEEDARKAAAVEVDLIFAPSPRDMYPVGFDSTVSCGAITTRLEGAARPGHFDGVTTVVLKLFNIVLPHIAVFGQKDAQQALVIRRMVEDLNVPVELIILPTVRESDGLAMSSRNVYLTKEERIQAPMIFKGLSEASALFVQGVRSVKSIKERVEHIYATAPLLKVEYIAVTDVFCNPVVEEIVSEALLSVVCRTKESGTRLIDNVMLQ